MSEPMKIIDGKAIAAELRAELKEKIDLLERKPGLAVVIVGEDPFGNVHAGRSGSVVG